MASRAKRPTLGGNGPAKERATSRLTQCAHVARRRSQWSPWTLKDRFGCQSSPRPGIDRRNVVQIMATPSLLDTGRRRSTLARGDREAGRWPQGETNLHRSCSDARFLPDGSIAAKARISPKQCEAVLPRPLLPATGPFRGTGSAGSVARAAKKPEWGQQFCRQADGLAARCAPFGRAAGRLSRAGDRRSPIERNWLARYRNG